ncbi:stage V sporulation protein AD [Scopulibacillus darangshiensis]|uniref:Stage V sporulation protein AD n=1 Tax=Scopulibacillus darangshiensis TaxID=442528 RepID=A0A4R2PBN6_9BACL|nr:stage V sporulation protein AD [Scopulibacillus darangshiensis]TCP31724.1 stage V sporulation protein AD [Scopulibacillus darangshiensis]
MKIGKQTWRYQNKLYLTSTGTAAGPLEAKGPLGSSFDKTYDDLHCGEDNWELAERTIMREAISFCLQKANKQESDIDVFLAGDLLNQTVTSNFIAKENQIPFLGMFGACSTSMETLAVGAELVDSGFANYALCAVSSHNATAERQFRYPTEYGGPKPKTATYTVTGAGAALVSKDPSPVMVKEATIGKVVDWGIGDANDMGSAMAPAAADTIAAHFQETGRTPTDYDMIVTGDLSSVGSPIVKQLLWEKGFNIDNVHHDCGLMIYSPDQPVFAGGSGCACSAAVTFGYIASQLASGVINRVLVAATGALLNPTIIQQKETIPCVAHAVVLESAGGQ